MLRVNEVNKVSSENPNARYPTSRYRYCYKIGDLAQQLIGKVLGNSFTVCKVNENGIDITNSKLSIGIEIWNHSRPHSYEDRINSVIKNLKPFKYKFLVTSFISSAAKEKLEAEGITIIILWKQILPLEWFPWYKERNRHYLKIFVEIQKLSKRILNDLKQALTPILNIVKRLCVSSILSYKKTSYTVKSRPKKGSPKLNTETIKAMEIEKALGRLKGEFHFYLGLCKKTPEPFKDPRTHLYISYQKPHWYPRKPHKIPTEYCYELNVLVEMKAYGLPDHDFIKFRFENFKKFWDWLNNPDTPKHIRTKMVIEGI